MSVPRFKPESSRFEVRLVTSWINLLTGSDSYHSFSSLIIYELMTLRWAVAKSGVSAVHTALKTVQLLLLLGCTVCGTYTAQLFLCRTLSNTVSNSFITYLKLIEGLWKSLLLLKGKSERHEFGQVPFSCVPCKLHHWVTTMFWLVARLNLYYTGKVMLTCMHLMP